MELLLNLVWLAVALAGFGLWWTRWSRASRDGGTQWGPLRSAIGLSCVLVLLFFAISLTDDLHAVPALAEDTRSTRRAGLSCKGTQADPDPDKQAALFVEAVSPTLFSPASVVVGWLSLHDSPSAAPARDQPIRSRAPPSPSSPAL